MPRLRRLQPALAALLAACVLLLGLAAMSPSVHKLICLEEAHDHPVADGVLDSACHADHDGDEEHGAGSADAHGPHACAVHLFTQGCTGAAASVLIAPAALNATGIAQFTELMLSRTLRGPERACGPPPA